MEKRWHRRWGSRCAGESSGRTCSCGFFGGAQSGTRGKIAGGVLDRFGGTHRLYEVQAEGSGVPDASARCIPEDGADADDAAGEAYDKVAKLLGSVSRGPSLDRLAAVSNGAPAPVKFGPTKMKGNALGFPAQRVENGGAVSRAREWSVCR